MLLLPQLGHGFQTPLELLQEGRVGKRRVQAFAQLTVNFHAGGGKRLSLELNLRKQGKIKVKQGVEEIKKDGLKSHQPCALRWGKAIPLVRQTGDPVQYPGSV